MKTTKLVIGIVSIVLFLVVIFQSCAAGIGNALEGNGETSGSSGAFLALCMLIAGIVGIATRSKTAGGIVSGVFYAIGGIIGISNYGSYSDLAVWSVLCFAFALVFILGSIFTRKARQTSEETKENEK